jgi:hypothetical protein
MFYILVWMLNKPSTNLTSVIDHFFMIDMGAFDIETFVSETAAIFPIAVVSHEGHVPMPSDTSLTLALVSKYDIRETKC